MYNTLMPIDTLSMCSLVSPMMRQRKIRILAPIKQFSADYVVYGDLLYVEFYNKMAVACIGDLL